MGREQWQRLRQPSLDTTDFSTGTHVGLERGPLAPPLSKGATMAGHGELLQWWWHVASADRQSATTHRHRRQRQRATRRRHQQRWQRRGGGWQAVTSCGHTYTRVHPLRITSGCQPFPLLRSHFRWLRNRAKTLRGWGAALPFCARRWPYFLLSLDKGVQPLRKLKS